MEANRWISGRSSQSWVQKGIIWVEGEGSLEEQTACAKAWRWAAALVFPRVGVQFAGGRAGRLDVLWQEPCKPWEVSRREGRAGLPHLRHGPRHPLSQLQDSKSCLREGLWLSCQDLGCWQSPHHWWVTVTGFRSSSDYSGSEVCPCWLQIRPSTLQEMDGQAVWVSC